jgi:hypothetical protein
MGVLMEGVVVLDPSTLSDLLFEGTSSYMGMT